MGAVRPIATPRLQLVPLELKHIDTLARGRDRLGELLRVSVPPNWPVFGLKTFNYWRGLLASNTDLVGWTLWFMLHRDDGRLIGDAGFKGRPDADGAIEIGYSVLPAYRRRGLATEACVALMKWAVARDAVVVRANTLADGEASQALLRHLGFTRRGESGGDGERIVAWSWSAATDAIREI